MIFRVNLCRLGIFLLETFFVPIVIPISIVCFFVDLSMDMLSEHRFLLYSYRYWSMKQRIHDVWAVFMHLNVLHFDSGTSSYCHAWIILHQGKCWSWVVASMSTSRVWLKFDSFYDKFRLISWINFSVTFRASLQWTHPVIVPFL